jgi:hypothetical protein
MSGGPTLPVVGQVEKLTPLLAKGRFLAALGMTPDGGKLADA